MSQFSTAINSVQTLRAVMGLAGDNIANANSPGYHARRAEVAPRPGATRGGLRVGDGSVVQSVTRLRDVLGERLLLADLQVLERVEQEEKILNHVEMSFQEPSEESLDAYLGHFFDKLCDLASDPDDTVMREELVQMADSLSNSLNRLAGKLRVIKQESRTELERTVKRVNGLLARAAELNRKIAGVEVGGVSAPGLKDQRDQTVRELAKLLNVTAYDSENGVVNVSMAGSLLVDASRSIALDVGEKEGGFFIGQHGHEERVMEVREGKIAGLLEGLNSFLPAVHGRLDELANALRRQFNRIHTTGLGLDGRFETLRGENVFLGDTRFCEAGYGVSEGIDERLVINVENQNSGEVSQQELSLDTTLASDAFLTDISNKINAGVDHLHAEIQQGRLCLEAEDGFAFGFATPYDPNPAEPGDITAATPAAPQIIDSFNGEEDREYEVTFLNSGEVGADEIEVQIQARRSDGTAVGSFTRSVSADYQPSDGIAIKHDMKMTLTAGNVNAGDSFSFTAHAEMDTAGVLDALGLNTFFKGRGAASLEVVETVKKNPSRIAAALRKESGDNQRLRDMEALQSRKVLDEGNASLFESYRGLITEVGTAHSTRTQHRNSLEETVTELENEVDGVSGVSVDEEMMELLESQRLYQASAKYIKSVDSTLVSLLELI